MLSIDRDNVGAPRDEELENLGRSFYFRISDMHHDLNFNNHESLKVNKEKAIEILKNIEERSAYLINEKVEEAKGLLKSLGITKL